MSTGNGAAAAAVNGSPPGTAAKQFLARPKSRGYAPKAYGFTLDFNDQRPFFRLVDVERMRRDPQIQFGLRILRAPLRKVKVKIRAKSPEVGQFVLTQFRRIWKRALIKLSRIFAYGYAPGEWVYGWQKNPVAGGPPQVVFRDLIDFHPFDAKPLVLDGQLVGLELDGVPNHAGPVRIGSPRMCWAIGDQEYNGFFGRSRLLNAWTPWMEKVGRHGALDIRRLWYLKNAYRGDTFRHPAGTTIDANGHERDNQDIAREIVEKKETGGVIALPNTRDEKGNFEWLFEPAAIQGDLRDVRDYPKDLDREILLGLGIPPEVVQASGESGSGYAGRSIPAEVFYASEDEAVCALIETADRQCIRPMVGFNFGTESWYEIEPESLAPKPPQQPVSLDGRQQGQDDSITDERMGSGAPPVGKKPADLAFSLAGEDWGDPIEAVRREAKRRFPLNGWVRLSSGEWVRSAAKLGKRKRKTAPQQDASLSLTDPLLSALPPALPNMDANHVHLHLPERLFEGVVNIPAPIVQNEIHPAAVTVQQLPAPIVQNTVNVPDSPAPVVNTTVNVPEPVDHDIEFVREKKTGLLTKLRKVFAKKET